MDTNKNQIVDLELIRQFAGDDKSIVTELVDVFLKQTPLILESLQNSVNDQDWEEVSKSVHKLKPSMGTLGMNAEKDLALQIENDCKNGDTSVVRKKVDVLLERCLLAINELKHHSEEA